MKSKSDKKAAAAKKAAGKQNSKKNQLVRSSPGLMALEPRFMFDGAGMADVADTLVTDSTLFTSDSDLVISALETAVYGPAYENRDDTLESDAADTDNIASDSSDSDNADTDNSVPQQLIIEGAALLNNPVAIDTWETALAQVEQLLSAPTDAEHYLPLLQEVFGNAGTDPETFTANAAAIADLLGGEGFGIVIELRSSADLNGALAAYAAVGHTGSERIYVNADWINMGFSSDFIRQVLLEEIGHALDRHLNGNNDSPGDEGQVFAARLTGQDTNKLGFALDNDHAVLQIDGVSIAVEKASFEINLTTGNDTYTAGAGDFTIYGLGGNDTITTAAGNAIIHTLLGNDTITTGAGNAFIRGGDGNNTITAGAGDNKVTTGTGNDTITTGAGNAIICGGDGNNTITAGVGDNKVTTGTGDDTITTGDGAGIVISGAGHDTITTGDGADIVVSGAGHDIITTGAGADIIFSGEGDDIITAGAGADIIDSGAGNDRIALGADGGDIDTVIFGANAATNGSDTITQFTTGVDKLNLAAMTTQTATTAVTGALTVTAGNVYFLDSVVTGAADSVAESAAQLQAGATWTNASNGVVAFFIVTDANSSAIYQYLESGGDGITAGELTLMATVDTRIEATDLVFVSNAAAAAAELTAAAAGCASTVIGGNTSGTGAEDGGAITGTLTASDTDGLTDGSYFTVTGAASNGAASINVATGAWTYTPNADYNGADSFTVTVTDDAGNTTTQVISLTVTEVVDIASDTASVDEDTAAGVTTNVRSNDSFEGTPVITAVTQGGNGAVVIVDANAGTVKYTPNANFNGTDTYTYTVTSGGKTETATVTVTVTVTAVNGTPVANADAVTTAEDTPVTINVLANDTDADGDTLSVTAASASNGTVTINTNGTLAYAPNANFNGSDTISYSISDGKGGTSTASVTVTVTAVNDAPVANADAATTAEDTSVTISVLGNDTDADGDTLSVTAASASNGTVTINTNGTLAYAPNANFSGSDTISYSISDGKGGTSTASVTVTVTAVNDAPVANADTATTTEDTPVTISVLGNDTDADGDTLSVSAASAGNGTVSINANGTLAYTPNPNFNGSDTINYSISDGKGGTASASVTVTVTPVNDLPVASSGSVTVDENSELNGTVPAATDSDGTVVSYTLVNGPTAGSLSFAANGSYSFVPGADFDDLAVGEQREVSFTYLAVDNEGGSSNPETITIIVTGVNDAPNAANDALVTEEDTELQIAFADLLGNDSDIDGDTLTISSFTQPANGTLVDNGAGGFSYTPNENYHGADSFTYTVSDGQGGTSTATVLLTVNQVNDAPVASADEAITDEDTPITITVLDNDSDADGDTLSVTAASAGNGTVTINADGSLAYTPNENFNGTDIVTYTVSDGQGGTDTATVTVTVTPVNDAPVAGPDTATTNEDTPVTIAVLDNVTDVDGDTLSVTAASARNGTVTINPDGTVTYTPAENFFGTDTITYTISDGQGGTATETVTVTVTSVNDAPVAVADATVTDEDTPITITVLDNDSDADGDTLSVTAASAGNGTVTINADGSLAYTPNENFNGADTVTYSVSDGQGGTDTATVTVTVTAVNDAPVANPDATTIDEDTPVTIDVLANDTDVDGDTLSVVAGRADNGSVTINSDGSITYLPNANFNGSDTITYAVSDNSGGTTTVSFTITVLPVNDAASRTGTAQGSVTENVNVVAGNLSFTGTMAVTDVDGPAEAAFLTGSENVRSSPGTLGTLQITETGHGAIPSPTVRYCSCGRAIQR